MTYLQRKLASALMATFETIAVLFLMAVAIYLASRGRL